MVAQLNQAHALEFLRLSATELSQVAAGESLEQITSTFDLAAQAFDGDAEKTALWFRTKNPMLGDIAPRDMIRLGRFDRLRRFIVGAIAERAPSNSVAH